MKEIDQCLAKYISEKKPSIISKDWHTYLAYNGIMVSHIHILKTGTVKTSIILHDGREFNLAYMNDPGIVAILRGEENEKTPAPWNIRVESKEASFYQIDRKEFWHDVNSDPELLLYIKNYYRSQLNNQTRLMKELVMNGKVGALYASLLRFADQFGYETNDGVMIDLLITNEDLAGFCGISAHTSVNRMMKDLRSKGVLEVQQRKIVIKNMAFLKDNIAN